MTQLLVFLLVLVCGTADEPPRPFVDIAHAAYPADYYTEQARRWAEVVDDACATEADYLEYYLAARYANRHAGGNYNLEDLARQAATRLDTAGFALNYLRYVHHLEGDGYEYLRAAYAAAPDHRYVQHAMLGYAMISGDAELVSTLSQRLDRMDPYPTGLNDYNYNTLASVAENGLLITFGDADTYPAWVLQQAQGVRPDVLIVNYYLLGHKEGYAKRIFAAAGLAEQPAVEATARLAQLRTSDRSLHLAATVGDRVDSLGISKEDLYTVGLTFRVSVSPVENLSVTRRLYGEVWRLDELRRPLSQSPQHRVGLELSPNYLVPLIELLKQDRVEGRPEDPALRVLVDDIARRNELTARVATLLGISGGDIPQLASSSVSLTAKEVFKGYMYGSVPRRPRGKAGKDFVPDYLVKTAEVSNAEYQLFLEDLLRQRKYDYLDSARIAPANWLSLLPDSVAQLPESEIYRMGRPESPRHPIVNISHRAAELYAIWITQLYNQDPKREGGRDVRFRLPTAAEFEEAARGGKAHAPYPWGGPNYRNLRGCILANLNTTLLDDKWTRGDYTGTVKLSPKERERDCRDDGALVTAPTDSYYPNDYGLYNMAGNAAEMTDVHGQTMGGSWLDGPGALRNGVITERQLPSPTTGFRLVMEYVD